MTKIRLSYVLILLMLFGCDRCNQKQDPCPPQLTAGFNVYETNDAIENYNLKSIWTYYDTDTLLDDLARYIRFEAQQEGAKYEWYIGIDTFRTQKVVINFTNYLLTQFSDSNITSYNIKIRLKVRKKPDTRCDNAADSVKELTRTVTVTTKEKWTGKYRGYMEDDPNTPYTINVAYYYEHPNFAKTGEYRWMCPYILNLNNKATDTTLFTGENAIDGYRITISKGKSPCGCLTNFDKDGHCYVISDFIGRLSDNNSKFTFEFTEVGYTYKNDLGRRRKFIGTRVP